jgi:hypothetical protein
VLAAEVPHYADLLHEAVLASFFTVYGFFRKGLRCVLESIVNILYEVDGSEIAFADLLDGFILFVEAGLIKVGLEESMACVLVSCHDLECDFLIKEGESEGVFSECKSKVEAELEIPVVVLDAFLVDEGGLALALDVPTPQRTVKQWSSVSALADKQIFYHASSSKL